MEMTEVTDVLAGGKNRYSRLLTRLPKEQIFTLYSFSFHLVVLLRTSKSCIYIIYIDIVYEEYMDGLCELWNMTKRVKS